MNMMGSATDLAALCAAAAVWALTAPRPAVVRLRAVLTTRGRAWHRRVAAHAGSALAEIRGRGRRERLWRAAVIELCDGFAAELAAGRAPAAAYAEAAAVLDPAVAIALLRPGPGEELPKTLDRIAGTPGAGGLRLLAACWRIGAERGGTFATVIDNLAATLRDQEAHREEVAAQLAGPRATARLLAGLPVLGLGMAAALGAHPLVFLLGTPLGAACLVAGAGLDALGLWWTGRLAAAAEVPR
jgi:tight adherence protein B